jgi:diacylglycerol kinase family enzyme
MDQQRASAVTTAQRLTAVAALACFVVLLVAAARFLIDNVGSLVLGLGGLVVAVTGLWWIVTERASRRATGIAAAAVGIAIITAALALSLRDAEQVILRAVGIAVVLVVMLACAHRALRPQHNRVPARARSDGPPRQPVLLCNPWSGGGKVERFGLLDLAASLGVRTVVLERGLDLEQLAREAIARGADCLGMAGGDGSQALVASIAIEHSIPFVCVSAGTRNHFALDLGLNRYDPRESIYAFRDAIERRVDYATVNGRLFVNNVSLGVYAQVVQQESYRDAKLQTTRNLLPEILGRQAEPFDLQFSTPTHEAINGAILIMVSNNPYVIGASPDNAQRRRLDSGQLGVFAITTNTGAAAARLFAAAAVGRRQRSPFWHEFTATNFEVRSRSGHAFAGIDGEALDLATPLDFSIHPQGLTLLVRADNIQAAEQREAREIALRDLIAIATGGQRHT